MTPIGSTCAICGADLPALEGRGRPRKVCTKEECQAVAQRRRCEAKRRAAGALPRGVNKERRAFVLMAIRIYGTQTAAAAALGISK